MGDTFHDPVDHARTTRQHAGESMIDVAAWPGYLLIFAGLIAFVGSLAAFGAGHPDSGMVTGAVAVTVVAGGLVWLAFEKRRVHRIENRWYAEHPDVPRQRPSN